MPTMLQEGEQPPEGAVNAMRTDFEQRTKASAYNVPVPAPVPAGQAQAYNLPGPTGPGGQAQAYNQPTVPGGQAQGNQMYNQPAPTIPGGQAQVGQTYPAQPQPAPAGQYPTQPFTGYNPSAIPGGQTQVGQAYNQQLPPPAAAQPAQPAPAQYPTHSYPGGGYTTVAGNGYAGQTYPSPTTYPAPQPNQIPLAQWTSASGFLQTDPNFANGVHQLPNHPAGQPHHGPVPAPGPGGFDAPENTPLPAALCTKLGVPIGTLWGPPPPQTFVHEGQTYPFKDVKTLFETFSQP